MPPICIHTINARDSVMLKVMQSYFQLTPQQMLEQIQQLVAQTTDILKSKGISYQGLRGALVPSQDRHEIAFIFDTTQIDSSFYGYAVFDVFLPLFDRKGSHSVLTGDYSGRNRDQHKIRQELSENLCKANTYRFQNSSQFFIVYVNNLSDTMIESFHTNLAAYVPYIGYLDFTLGSSLKTYISTVVAHSFILHKRYAIMDHEDDVDNTENCNMPGYPFEEHGFTCRSLQSSLSHALLSYKIERPVFPGFESDTTLTLNAISVNPTELIGFKVRLDVDKLGYLLENKTASLAKAGLLDATADKIEELIRERLTSNYIYNVCYNDEYDTWKFNIMIEVKANETARPTRLLVALEYLPQETCVRVITLF